MSGRPVASRSRTPMPGRRTRPVRRASAGYSFADVCARVVELARERHAARVAGRLGPGDLPR